MKAPSDRIAPVAAVLIDLPTPDPKADEVNENAYQLAQDIIDYAKDWEGDENATCGWVYGVAETGNFECPEGLAVQYGDSYIPNGWSVNGVAPAATESFAASATKSAGDIHLKPLAPKTLDIQDRLIEHEMIRL